MGLPSALFLVLLILKLCGVIAWSWWWVTAPLWVEALILLTIISVALKIRNRFRF